MNSVVLEILGTWILRFKKDEEAKKKAELKIKAAGYSVEKWNDCIDNPTQCEYDIHQIMDINKVINKRIDIKKLKA